MANKKLDKVWGARNLDMIQDIWFKDHTVVKESNNKFTWRNPSSFNYCVNYMITPNHLIVTGDLDEAIYLFGCPRPQLDVEWLFGTNLDYFASKCVASPYGRGYSRWDSVVIENHLKKTNFDEIPKDLVQESLDMCTNEFEFKYFLYSNDICHDSVLWEIGKVVDNGCEAHLIGLHMIHLNNLLKE